MVTPRSLPTNSDVSTLSVIKTTLFLAISPLPVSRALPIPVCRLINCVPSPVVYPARAPSRATTICKSHSPTRLRKFGATLGFSWAFGTSRVPPTACALTVRVFFILLQCLLIEKLAHGSGTAGVVVFKKEKGETKKLNDRLKERREDFNAGKLEQDVSDLKMEPKPFTWAGLNYTVPVKGGSRQLLNDVWGYVKPGSLTALMGASGAGKTTLLDVLADRKTTGVVSWRFYLDFCIFSTFATYKTPLITPRSLERS